MELNAFMARMKLLGCINEFDEIDVGKQPEYAVLAAEKNAIGNFRFNQIQIVLSPYKDKNSDEGARLVPSLLCRFNGQTSISLYLHSIYDVLRFPDNKIVFYIYPK